MGQIKRNHLSYIKKLIKRHSDMHSLKNGFDGNWCIIKHTCKIGLGYFFHGNFSTVNKNPIQTKFLF